VTKKVNPARKWSVSLCRIFMLFSYFKTNQCLNILLRLLVALEMLLDIPENRLFFSAGLADFA